jgi:hypothetical protein
MSLLRKQRPGEISARVVAALTKTVREEAIVEVRLKDGEGRRT